VAYASGSCPSARTPDECPCLDTIDNRPTPQPRSDFMPSRLFVVLCALTLLAPTVRAQKAPEKIDKADLRALLEKVRETHAVPALGAAVVSKSGVVQLAVVGVRKRGEKQIATESALFHLGSCTKPMTATLIAALIQKKQLSYDRTLAQAFPELSEKMPE